MNATREAGNNLNELMNILGVNDVQLSFSYERDGTQCQHGHVTMKLNPDNPDDVKLDLNMQGADKTIRGDIMILHLLTSILADQIRDQAQHTLDITQETR